jgi:predicted metallopeptidase
MANIKYQFAPDIHEEVDKISTMMFPHVKKDSVVCLRSFGSKSRGTVARCHSLSRAMQIALGRKGFYVIEIVSERFDKMNEKDKIKTLIHELMHIPLSFGGGFKFHDYVCDKNINIMYDNYIQLKEKKRNEIQI